jgi:hypothetical protein
MRKNKELAKSTAQLEKTWREYLKKEKRDMQPLRAAAVTLAQGHGMEIDDIERAALDEIYTTDHLVLLVVMLAFAGNTDEARGEWARYFRDFFGQRVDYRLKLEVKQFIKDRARRLQREAAAASKSPKPRAAPQNKVARSSRTAPRASAG